MTPYQRFCAKWGKGCGAPECEAARHVVLARGSLPCDVLFVGEAPGESEDVRGIPFDGPAGAKLDRIIRKALAEWQVPGTEGPDYNTIRWCLTNLVGCIPREEDGGKAAEPLDEQIRQCAPRLQEFVRLADPKLIVCVGKLADDWLDPKWKNSIKLHKPLPRVAITHPAAILRMDVARQWSITQNCVVALTTAVEDYVIGGK